MVWTTHICAGGSHHCDVRILRTHFITAEDCEVIGLCAIQYGADILMEAMEKWLEQL